MSAYILVQINITNPESYKEYLKQVTPTVVKYGGEYIVRGPAIENLEGALLQGKSVIVTRFEDEGSVNAFFKSEEYQALKPMREGTGIYDIGIFNGVE